MTRTRFALVALAAALASAPAPAQSPARFARTPDISPDGKRVAFSYLGDIWVVDAAGGVARPVTMHEAHDIGPVFSPDGRSIAFSSNRHGSYDVFVVSAEGGRPRRLTYDSASDLVTGWSPDGKQVLFTSTRGLTFPHVSQVYTVPAEGGRVRRVSADEGKEAVFSPRGDQIAYVRGPGTWYRKGYRGSSNDDIWVCNADGTHNRRLTMFNGQDTSPMWSPDGQFIYYVSEYFGSPANVVRQDAGGRSAPQPVTSHKDEAVRQARISRDGAWIVYECGPDLWVVSTRGGPPRKLAVEVHADDKANTDQSTTYTQGASEFALARDEQHIAFVVHGEIFLMPIRGGKATRVTDSPAYDHSITWAPNGHSIVFASDRDGQEDLYKAEADDPDHPRFVDAHKFKVKRLTHTPEPELGVSFSPDGRRIAFLRAGKLWTMHADGSEAKPVTEDTYVFDYEWSPDSKWLVYARQDGYFASELYVVPATGPTAADPARNVTRYATYNGGVTWSAQGNKLAFVSTRRQLSTVYVLPLQKPAAGGGSESRGGPFDWEGIHLRARQVAPLEAEEAVISPDGSKVAFRSTGLAGDDLWVASSDGGQVTRLTSGSVRPHQIQWSRNSSDRVYFRDARGTIRRMWAGSAGEPATVPFRAKMVVRRDEEFAEMFEQSWRALREHFYDPKFHGANWDAVRAKYRPLVKHVALREDLYALISLMLGELNASHLGISGHAHGSEERTAELGLLFDEAYDGPGLKIAEVIKGGPADRRGIALKAGDVVRSIEGVEITPQTNVSRLLNDKVGEPVVLRVAADPKDPKASRRVEVQGVPREQVGPLMYRRWVDANARRVADLSQGKLGYIHIPDMQEDGLDQFIRSLYSDNFDKEAIVLDVRYNGGGFTHDQVLNYLGAREHTVFRQRYGGEGLVLRSYDRKWTRPLVLLINNRSYSDAEIFPNAFRTLGLGKLVGQATGGHVIGTSSVRLIDGSFFRVPRTGVYTVGGEDMETQGVAPDVAVELHPDEVARGRDAQLDKAVDVLRETVVQWKRSHPRMAMQPAAGAGKPSSSSAAPAGK